MWRLARWQPARLVIRVLIVEDEPNGPFAEADCVVRFVGFTVLTRTRSGAEAMRQLRHGQVDLVLLDIESPDMGGFELLRMIRSHGYTNDVIAVIRGDDAAALRLSLCYGVLYCLVKPVSFTVMRQGLEGYCDYRDRLARCAQLVAQAEVDDLLASRHDRGHGHLPKGVSAETLDSVLGELCAADGRISATEVARILGASRVTARRYLEYLADAGLAQRDLRYGGGRGRPEVEYQLRQWPRQEDVTAAVEPSVAVH
jgi:response regulator of citrate/malate metabolism